MKFVVVKNGDTDLLAAIIVQDSKGLIGYAASTDWYFGVLKVLLERGRFYEERHEDNHVFKERISREDNRYFEILRHKLSPPMVVVFWGEMTESATISRVDDAIRILWPKFSPEPAPETKKAA